MTKVEWLMVLGAWTAALVAIGVLLWDMMECLLVVFKQKGRKMARAMTRTRTRKPKKPVRDWNEIISLISAIVIFFPFTVWGVRLWWFAMCWAFGMITTEEFFKL